MLRPSLAAWSLIAVFAAVTEFRVAGAPNADQTPAQSPQSTATAPKADEDEGFPITSPAVLNACGDCHKVDTKQRFSRISYRRTTPEGWQETIRRMVSLNKAQIDPAQAREVVKYLSDHQGLAPEELKPATFEVERRLIDFKYTGDAETERVCTSCHSIGRVMLQRRSAEEWNLLINMHRGYYPLVDFQVFRRNGPPETEPGPDGRPPDNRHPYEKALAHLKSAFPLHTPEWTAWSATMRNPVLAGVWALRGYEAGAGPFYGQVTIKASASSPDEFTTETTYTYSRGGRTVTRQGRTLIYTGYQWRGRSTVGSDDNTSLREVMMLDRDWRTLQGRWFTGEYDELGVDVELTRVGRDTVVLGLDRPALKTGSSTSAVRVFGANFPTTLTASDIDFGRGVTVSRVQSVTSAMVTVDVTVAPDAPLGARDVFIGGGAARSAVAIYDHLDYIKVSPAWNMARVGGVVHPKMFAQFEAIGYCNGPDGKPDTSDDVAIGPLDAIWTVEEYTATYDDDDVKFVGEIDGQSGRFTPALDGPNPARSGNRNNVGDVWVVATVTPTTGATPLRARAHLVVTVPLFMRWDFSGVGR